MGRGGEGSRQETGASSPGTLIAGPRWMAPLLEECQLTPAPVTLLAPVRASSATEG